MFIERRVAQQRNVEARVKGLVRDVKVGGARPERLRAAPKIKGRLKSADENDQEKNERERERERERRDIGAVRPRVEPLEPPQVDLLAHGAQSRRQLGVDLWREAVRARLSLFLSLRMHVIYARVWRNGREGLGRSVAELELVRGARERLFGARGLARGERGGRVRGLGEPSLSSGVCDLGRGVASGTCVGRRRSQSRRRALQVPPGDVCE